MDISNARVQRRHDDTSSAELRFSGGWILPGLIDAHLHLTLGSLSLTQLDLAGTTSHSDFMERIARRHALLPAGQWLEAFGWDESLWGGGQPDASWLEPVGERPAVAWRCDQHVALCNRAALALLDLSRDVAGGTIARDASGRPTGLLLEQAAWQLLIPRIPTPPIEEQRSAVQMGCRHLLSLGVTAVGAMEYLQQVEEVLDPLRRNARLGVRVAVTVLDRASPLPIDRARRIERCESLRVIGFKSFADGTLGAATAAMIDPYENAAGSGTLVEHALEGTLEAWMREVLAADYSPSVHAIGDRALAETLACAERCDPTRRVRFEHAQTVDPASHCRFAGRRVSMQPLHKFGDSPVARARLGEQRMNRVFRFRDFHAHGACLAFGSDWPIVSASPIEGMRCAITGITRDGSLQGVDQSLTPTEAIDAYTIDAARCLESWEGIGTLAHGAHADMVVLDRNPLACDWLRDPPRVLCTIVDGRIAHDGRSAARA
jgi:predicted amidohydrolase YtcJ